MGRAVLFDLDGTLLDTINDLLFALNVLRSNHDLPTLSFEKMRPLVGLGSKAMIKESFGINEDHDDFKPLRHQFLKIYENHLADSTQFFPQTESLLLHLDEKSIPWGIVTNKLTVHSTAVLKALNLDKRTACLVCGDTLSTYKPDPAPLLYASQLLNVAPQDCLYLGDAITDVIASKAAGMKALVAMYGYIPSDDNPRAWQADGYIQNPMELLTWL